MNTIYIIIKDILPVSHHVSLLVLMIVHIVRERAPVSSVTQSRPGAVIGARPGTWPVAGPGASDWQGAGVNCAVKNISEARIITAGAATCYLLVLLTIILRYKFIDPKASNFRSTGKG